MSKHSLSRIGALFVVAALAFAAGCVAQARYPDIDAAENTLQAALGNLHAARDVFGGHKVTAERLINEAIGELEAGKQFAAANGY